MNWRVAIALISIPVFAGIIWWRGIKLGLDLKGGSYFLLQVRSDIAVEKFVERVAGEMLSLYREKFGDEGRAEGEEEEAQERAEVRENVLFQGNKIYVRAPLSFINELKEKFPSFEHVGKEFLDGVEYDVFVLRDLDRKEIEEFAVTQALEIIRNRIDEFGVAEPQIFRQGKSRIVVQLPGIHDPARAKKIIGKTALLEFRLVDDETDFFANIVPPEGIYKSVEQGRGKPVSYLWAYDRDYEKLKSFVEKLTPPFGRIIFVGRGERDKIWRTFLLDSVAHLTGEFLRDARVRINNLTGEPYVLLRFNSEGAEIFDRLTSENVGRRLAIVLDEKVYSAPVIRERITGGVATIEGGFTIDEARDLAAVLRAGALPAPVSFEEERTVGPSLGEDSIKKGTIASISGAFLVAVFMFIYYKLSGVMAVFGVVIALLFTLAVLSLFGATLTLPGIAGLALTVGMTVDNNIIIFERIREEILRRFSIKPSVDTGYRVGMRTVLDANITTLIAALFIFQFGTGPVRGFALTLSIGILGALYGAVFCTKAFMDWLTARRVFSI